MTTTKHSNHHLKTLQDIFEDNKLLDLEENLDMNQFDYSSKEQLFKTTTELMNITIKGKFVNFDTKIRCKCGICGVLFDKTPRWTQKNGCPQCKVIRTNEAKTRRLWARSCQIIQDKKGSIVKLPEHPITETPSVQDGFGLKCKHGHNFKTTHRELASDKWCPICHVLTGKNKAFAPKSQATYSETMTSNDKFKRIKEVAEIKGTVMISAMFSLSGYDLRCSQCDEAITRTGKQILENKFLCKNKCVQGTRFNLYSDKWDK